MLEETKIWLGDKKPDQLTDSDWEKLDKLKKEERWMVLEDIYLDDVKKQEVRNG